LSQTIKTDSARPLHSAEMAGMIITPKNLGITLEGSCPQAFFGRTSEQSWGDPALASPGGAHHHPASR